MVSRRAILLFFKAVLCTSVVYGLPQDHHAVHENIDGAPAPWTRVSAASINTPIDLRFALKQSNLECAEEFMRDVSHPQSQNYGRFWLPEKVMTFAPSENAVAETVEWLLRMGVSSKRISQSTGRNWIKVNSTVAEAQRLLHTIYSTYEDDEGMTLVACEPYVIPLSIRNHIDFVSPTIQFDPRTGKVVTKRASKRESLEPKITPLCLDSDPSSLDHCDQMITPACLRAM